MNPIMAGCISIREEFSNTVVLVTGGTGYIGGLVLEALLRTTTVRKVYVLLRPKAGQEPQQRVAKLLQVSVCAWVAD